MTVLVSFLQSRSSRFFASASKETSYSSTASILSTTSGMSSELNRVCLGLIF